MFGVRENPKICPQIRKLIGGGPGKLLYDFSGFEDPKIAIFLSVLSGFEAHKENFCGILVQLSRFEDKFGKKNCGSGTASAKSGPKIFWLKVYQ